MASKMNNKRLDKTFQQKVEHVQKHNGIHVFWNKEGVWKRIQKALEDSAGSPKMIAWYAAMAASVSLLVASSLSFDQLNFDFLQKEEVEEEKASVSFVKSDENAEIVRLISLPADQTTLPIRSRQKSMLQASQKIDLLKKLPEQKKKFLYSRIDLARKSKTAFRPKFRVKLVGGISANSKYVTPRIDFGVAMDVSKTEAIKKRLFVGTSVQFIKPFNGGEQTRSNSLPASYFVKSTYESERFEGGKRRGWSAGAEYLIHSKDDSLPNQMLKVFYSRSIMNKVKIGPEVMFTKGFKKVYPGITLAVG